MSAATKNVQPTTAAAATDQPKAGSPPSTKHAPTAVETNSLLRGATHDPALAPKQMPSTPEQQQQLMRETMAGGAGSKPAEGKSATEKSSAFPALSKPTAGLSEYASPGLAARERELKKQSEEEGERGGKEEGGAYPQLSTAPRVEEPEEEEVPVPQTESDVQGFALPIGARQHPLPTATGEDEEWILIDASDAGTSPAMLAARRHARELWHKLQPHAKVFAAFASAKARAAGGKMNEVLAHETTQSLATEAAEMVVHVAKQYRGSLQCLTGQLRAAPLALQVWQAVLAFLLVLVPLAFLALPESWICLKWALVSYAIGHSTLHFSGCRLAECIAASHIALILLLIELIVTPGTESLVLGHPGWAYVVPVRPADMILYLMWLRVSIAVVFSTLCFDAIAMFGLPIGLTEAAVAAPAVASAQEIAPSVGSGVDSAAAAKPTVIQVESAKDAKISVSLEPKESALKHQISGVKSEPQVKREDEAELKTQLPIPTPS